MFNCINQKSIENVLVFPRTARIYLNSYLQLRKKYAMLMQALERANSLYSKTLSLIDNSNPAFFYRIKALNPST